jgi:tubulin--tyrosine ligase-like protein 12
MGIKSLKQLPDFPETTETLSLYGNEIENPNEIANIMVPMPNLRALWLNENPVVDNCTNFNAIAELIPKCEIINSTLTNRAGEWAMLFYGKQQGAETLD